MVGNFVRRDSTAKIRELLKQKGEKPPERPSPCFPLLTLLVGLVRARRVSYTRVAVVQD